MPRPVDPAKPEFYVYRILADGVPFYVGVGPSARASDRVRHVSNLMRREAEGAPVKWSLHTRVLASLLRAGCTLEVEYRMTGAAREDALAQEDKEILELVSTGHVLANIQKNPQRPTSPEHVVDWVLARCGRASTWAS